MAPPLLVLVIPGVALIFLVQMLLCEAYHFHVTVTRHKKYARGIDAQAIQDGGDNTQESPKTKVIFTDNKNIHLDSRSNLSSDSDDISLDDTEFDPKQERNKRRKSVFAESYDPSKDDDYVQVVHPKTAEEKQWLMDNLVSITLFQHLAQDQVTTVVDAMHKNPVEKGEVIMRQGDKGNIFYVIQSGTYQVYVKDQEGNEKLMHTYVNKGSFGELALLYNQPRAATIVAASPGILWGVDGQTFRRIVHKITHEKRVMYEKLINHVPMLKALEPFECANLVDALIPITAKDGDKIISQGDKADGMYFVISGGVNIILSSEGKEFKLKELSGGDYFGELGLLTNQPRAASAYAVGKTQLAFLDREAFERLLGPCMDVMRRNISGYAVKISELNLSQQPKTKSNSEIPAT